MAAIVAAPAGCDVRQARATSVVPMTASTVLAPATAASNPTAWSTAGGAAPVVVRPVASGASRAGVDDDDPGGGDEATGPGGGGRVDYDPPVEAPITDPFRPPPQPWLPGNRGVEYATTPGTPVRAAGAGRVTFAGPVAGALHVTVAHADGVRTSYSYLATVAVRAGAEVAKGQVVGTSGARLHVGARRGEVYIDPLSLWGADGTPWVRLTPLDGVPGHSRAPPDRPRPTMADGHTAPDPRVGGAQGVAT